MHTHIQIAFKILQTILFNTLLSVILIAQKNPSQHILQLSDRLSDRPNEVIKAIDSVFAQQTKLNQYQKTHYLLVLSDAYYYNENIPKSTDYLYVALANKPNDFDTEKTLELFNNLGQNLSSLSFTDSAIYFYQKGLDLSTKVKDSTQSSMLYFNIGVEYMIQSDYTNSINYIDSSYLLALALNDSVGIGSSLKFIGRMKQALYDFESSIVLFKDALNYVNSDDPNLACLLYVSIGGSFLQLNKLDSAQYYTHLANQCFEHQGDPTTTGYLYLLEASIKKELKDSLGASLGFKKTMKWAKKLGELKIYYEAYLMNMEVDLKERTISNIEYLLEEDIRKIYPEKLISLYELYVSLLEELGRHKDANEALDILLKLERNRMKKESQLILQQQAVKFGLYEKEKELALTKLNYELEESKWRNLLVGSIFLALISIVFYYLYSQRKILNKERERLQQEKELLERIMLVEGQALRAQMNPHFIFNALNSIKGLVVTEQNKKAALYISKFSKLVRNVLDNSRALFIPLEKEIATLDIYIQLEQARFRDGFSYDIQWNKKTNSNILVPPALLQPFVENAIWHGFKNNPRPNQLSIIINVVGSYLYVTIKDNGVGIAESKKNGPSVKSRKSHGVAITSSRIEQYQIDDKKGNLSYDYLDNSSGVAWGTVVTIKLPVQHQI